MKRIGEEIFARDGEGKLISRIGTLFLRTPGLVTKRGVHAMQRVMWLDELNSERAESGKAALSSEEEEAELAESVDLIFTEDQVLIRPNPERMDLAFRADDELQKIVSKRCVRFLNTSSSLVRKALRERGENWRMARQPISQEDMADFIASSRVAIEEKQVYYYNRLTGTRYLTAGTFGEVVGLKGEEFKRQMMEIAGGISKRNRLGRPEIDVFPTTTSIDVRNALKALKPEAAEESALKAECERIAQEWRVGLPAELRDETVDNFDWRNEMCYELSRGPNETAAGEQEMIAGISPEFYRQIEWLPGARIDNGEVVFDELYEEAAKSDDPELKAMCDNRVKSFIFNTTRLFGKIGYINIGRISGSLSRKPVEGNRRGNVYIMQYLEEGAEEPKVLMIRLQKWGVAEHLDEGKDLLTAIIEADEYSDYILDRRLMCKQLGMNLPRRLGYGHFTEKYRGNNHYNGVSLKTAYFVRNYVQGTASDKVSPAKYRNPAWAQKFALLMGGAAALDMIVGRCSSVTRELLFDSNYEVVRQGADGLPEEILITDHAGSFVNYTANYADYVREYAAFAIARKKLVGDYRMFATEYVEGFRRKLAEVQQAYRTRKSAFDELFADRPYDSNGSGAYRWAKALERLDGCDCEKTAALLKEAVGC